MIDLKNSKLTSLGRLNYRNYYALDASIQPMQFAENGGLWQDIEPRLVQDAQGYYADKTPYGLVIDNLGSRRIYPDRSDKSKYLHLPASPLFNALPQTTMLKSLSFAAAKYQVVFGIRNSRMQFHVLMPADPGFEEIVLDAEGVGMDIAKLLTAKSGLGIPRPRLIDAEGTERMLEWVYKNGQLRCGFDLSGLKFPVRFQNVTLDLSVGADADDDMVRRLNTTAWYPTLAWLNVGSSSSTFHAFGLSVRFTSVNIPAGADLTTAPNSYLTLIAHDNRADTVVRSDLCTEDSNNPGQMASYADHVGRARTTPVAWDGIAAWTAGVAYQSLDISSCIQETVDNNGGTGDALICFFEDKDDESDTYARRSVASENHASYAAPAIHIEYSVGGGGPTVLSSNNPMAIKMSNSLGM